MGSALATRLSDSIVIHYSLNCSWNLSYFSSSRLLGQAKIKNWNVDLRIKFNSGEVQALN